MPAYTTLLRNLQTTPRRWLVTGAAGFIGSNLVETLLKANQVVTGLDNFSTGYRKNLQMVQEAVGDAWSNFTFIEGDIRDLETCRKACEGNTHCLHQAAIGSVPKSLVDPIFTNENNVDGFLNMLVAARDAGIRRFVYAASSSTYGDEPTLPKREERIGKPLSPYAITKYVNELYADVFAGAYGMKSIGLRYFNVFGQRQDPEGAYAAVIPLWFASILRGEQVFINGDGETSRDFCYIANCVQANLLAACSNREEAWNQVYNVAVNHRTSLNDLFTMLKNEAAKYVPESSSAQPEYREFRQGDVRHSQADISKIQKLLGYEPEFDVSSGLRVAGEWYFKHLS